MNEVGLDRVLTRLSGVETAVRVGAAAANADA